jgi:hypothetical protein
VGYLKGRGRGWRENVRRGGVEREKRGKVGVKGFNFICYKVLKGLNWLIDELMGEEEIKERMSWNQSGWVKFQHTRHKDVEV